MALIPVPVDLNVLLDITAQNECDDLVYGDKCALTFDSDACKTCIFHNGEALLKFIKESE